MQENYANKDIKRVILGRLKRMFVYGFTLGVLLLSTLLYHSKGFYSYGKNLITFSGIMLMLVAGLRYQVGTDYPHYVRGYYMYLTNDISSLLSQPALTVTARLANIFCDDYTLWFFIMSAITIIPVIIVINKYSVAPEMSILLYVLLGCWHFSFNVVKQSVAASLILLGYGSLRNKNFKVWVILCLIATTFHFSALLMIPIYYIASRPVSKWNTIIIVSIGTVMFLFYDRLFDIATILKNGKNLVGLYSSTRNDSVNNLRVIVNCAPILLFIVYRRSFDSEDSDFSILLNMSLLNAALNIGSMRSIYIHRMTLYTNIFNILLIPMLIQKIEGRDKRIIIVIMMLLYMVFWWYDLYKGSSTAVFHWIFER